jgi:RND family efflux transporter MFP subunit
MLKVKNSCEGAAMGLQRNRLAARQGSALSAPIVGSVIALTLAGCSEQNKYVPPPPPKVAVAQPVQRPATNYLQLTGNTQAFQSVTLNARVQGYLTSINYKDGAAVKKGDLLFGIEEDNYVAALDQAKANQSANEALQVQTQQQYTRQSTLGKQDFASQAAVEDAKAKLDQATAGVAGAKASVESSTINLGYTKVTAPFDGIVTNHLVDVGALVGVGGPTQLATIVQIDPIYVYFNVSEQQVLIVKEALAKSGRAPTELDKTPVEIGLQTENGYPHKGHLDYVSPQLDASSGTLTVRGLFENKNRALLPGLFVRVRVPLQQMERAILVPDEAIGAGQQGTYVLVVGKDNVVEQRLVKLGQLQDDGLRVVLSGLGPDDLVVTGGILRAVPGSKVDPQKSPSPNSSGAKG